MDTSLLDHGSVDYSTADANLLKTKLEEKNQEIHGYKKQLEVALALEQDYQQEIEILQSNEFTKTKSLKAEIIGLESKYTTLKNDFNIKLEQKQERIVDLKKQIAEFSKAPKNKRESSDGDQGAHQNSELKEQMNGLQTNLMETESNINYLKVQTVSLEQTLNILVNELKEKNQSYNHISQELVSSKNTLQSMQEDAFLIKLELESAKSVPLASCSKGNSLFAEVEDSYQKIRQQLELKKKTYSRLKEEVTTKIKQLSIMRKQNIDLCTKLNTASIRAEDCDTLIEESKNKVVFWESIINDCKKETSKQLKLHGNDLQHYVVEFASETLNSKWASEKKLLEKLESESKKKLELYMEIEEVNAKIRRWRRKVQHLKAITEKLENVMSEIKLYRSLDASEDLKECFNTIEQEIREFDSNIKLLDDDSIVHCTKNDESLDETKYLEQSSTIFKSDNYMENSQETESKQTNITEVKSMLGEKLVSNDEESNIVLQKDLEINNWLQTLKVCEVKNESLESQENKSIVEVESTPNETISTEDFSTSNIEIITLSDSSVEIVDEFDIAETDTSYPQNNEINREIKQENVYDSLELSKIEETNSESSMEDKVINQETTLSTSIIKNENINLQIAQKENLPNNMQFSFDKKSYSTPLIKPTNRGASESKIINNHAMGSNFKLKQHARNISSTPALRQGFTAKVTSSLPPIRKYASQNGNSNDTTGIPKPARKKLI